MTTWGEPKRRERRRPAVSNDAAPTPAKGSRASTRATAVATPPTGTRRASAAGSPSEDEGTRREAMVAGIRDAADGREHEYAGVALVVLGVLLGLAVYLDLAGPLGDGVETVVGWFTGIGRHLVPPVIVGSGIALVHRGRSAQRMRLTLGWIAIAVAVLGILHVARGPADWSDIDALDDAGGLFGALVGAPLLALLDTLATVVVLCAALLVGVMLVGRVSVRSMAARAGDGLSAAGSAWRSRERRPRRTDDDEWLPDDDESPSGPSVSPTLYDFSVDDDWAEPSTSPRAPRRPPGDGRRATPHAEPVPSGPGEQQELDLGPGAQRGKWTLPPMTHLGRSNAQAIDAAEVDARGRTLVQSLASHGVETRLVGQTVGPTVTRYELELGAGVKVARITSLNRDIAYAMAATDVRILAPIPGRSAIGVEVPNHTRQLVSLGDILTAPEARAATHPLDVAVGKDIAGRAVFLNLATTPHLLIAGTTGAGKSSGINSIITSLLMRTTPEQVRLILIDPKQVEMGQYKNLPHLLINPVVNPKEAAHALGWAVKEMERRYDILFEFGFRDITGYNAAYDRGELQADSAAASGEARAFERLPYIVVVVDELNDLMMVAQRDVEDSITRIAQKARAVGVHLIVATQRPSVNVITGVIKANVPARVAYAVNSLVDSRVILDQSGAEKLVGKGDMLMLPGNSSVAQRIQGCFVSEDEVRAVVGHWRRQSPNVVYVTDIVGEGRAVSAGGGNGSLSSGDDDDEALVRQAIELVVRSQLGSTSMLQRKLKVGFARAGRLMDLLEERGVVGRSEGSKARAVLMTVQEFEVLREAGNL